jgi:hypothetical protein
VAKSTALTPCMRPLRLLLVPLLQHPLTLLLPNKFSFIPFVKRRACRGVLLLKCPDA